MTSKEIIRASYMGLPVHQRDLLLQALSTNRQEIVMLSNTKFIGVHVSSITNVEIEHKEDAWVLGHILP